MGRDHEGKKKKIRESKWELIEEKSEMELGSL